MTWGTRAAALAGALLLAAACGTQSGGPTVAAVNGRSGSAPAPSASANPAQLYAQFAACLRQHGASEPDPTIDDQGNPHWQVPLDNIPLAQKQSCFPLIQQARQRPAGPLTPAQIAAAAKFSQCMRSHGVSNFPDPDPQTGNFTGVSRTDPAIQQAYPSCSSLLPQRDGG
jgi:hypothetical protein